MAKAGRYAKDNFMDYVFSKIVNRPFEAAIADVTAKLQAQGFGVLTEIDVQATLKKKLGVAFRPYRILGACNPQFAYQALQAESHIGAMLPCNVVVQQLDDGQIEVSAVDPVASMAAIENPQLAGIAGEVRTRLQKVIDAL